MQRQTVGIIWIGGLVLALVLYLIGPDSFVTACLDLLAALDDAFHAFLSFLGTQAFNVVRAAAIAIFIVFLVLAFLAASKGLRAGWALVIVPITFLMLVWGPTSTMTGSISRWFAALVLVIIGGGVMTQRLLAPPPPARPDHRSEVGAPVVDERDVLDRATRGRRKFHAPGVGERDHAHDAVRLGDSEKGSQFCFEQHVRRGERAAETTTAQGQLEAPHRLVHRAEEPGCPVERGIVLDTPLDAHDGHHGHSVEDRPEVQHRLAVAHARIVTIGTSLLEECLHRW